MPAEQQDSSLIQKLHDALTKVDALPQLSLLAVVIGIATGCVIVVFRLMLESPGVFLPIANSENFEALSASSRAFLIIGGAVVMAVVLHKLKATTRQMSVSHVIDRTHNFQGKHPVANWLAQGFLAATAVSSGQCVGREGPAIHLGAGAASQLGQWLKLPNSVMQTLIACGVSAAISASFDTPLAGVIFAMEVIVMQYSIAGFVPVILASVSGAAITKIFFGASIAFGNDSSSVGDISNLIVISVLGLLIALCAGVYIRIHVWALRLQRYPVALRVICAGCITACVALLVPEVMGLGYDTIQTTINGDISLSDAALVAFAKLLLTPLVVALGIPGGLIGPTLFVGAGIGFCCGTIAQILFPDIQIDIALFALIGMTGMMAAVINAPLAALIAILELTHSPNMIFPAMLIISVACICTRQIFQVKGIFIEQLQFAGKTIQANSTTRELKQTSVMRVLNRNFVESKNQLTRNGAMLLLKSEPEWIIFENTNEQYALFAADLAAALEQDDEDEELLLSEIPGRRFMMAPASEGQSIYEGLSILENSQKKVLYIRPGFSNRGMLGIVTLESIQNFYQPKGI
jgi:H+/Cl- antiporter ClcA